MGQRVAARRAKRSPSSIISFGEALWQKVSNIAVSATVKRPEHATASASKKVVLSVDLARASPILEIDWAGGGELFKVHGLALSFAVRPESQSRQKSLNRVWLKAWRVRWAHGANPSTV